VGFSCTNVSVPGGASGVASNENAPKRASHADKAGFWRHGRSILRVIVAWGMSLHQWCIVNSSWTLHKPKMKCFFHVWIARLASF